MREDNYYYRQDERSTKACLTCTLSECYAGTQRCPLYQYDRSVRMRVNDNERHKRNNAKTRSKHKKAQT